jgi:homospermidine synthase
MIEFNKTLVVLGCGTIGMTTLRMLSREVKVARLFVIDKAFPTSPLPEDAKFYVECLSEDNYKEILTKYLTPGDICCNLAVVNSQHLLIWCMENDVLYLDTSGEEWEDSPENTQLGTLHKELSSALSDLYKKYPNKTSWATSIVYHGMNPGLVSHFVKQGLSDIAKQLLAQQNCQNREEILLYLKKEDWAHLSQALGVKAVHISERDTQCSKLLRNAGEFQSTWSVDAFLWELQLLSEFSIGTHEKYLPCDSILMNDIGQTSITLGTQAWNTRILSWVPSGPIDGILISHDECLTLGNFLEVRDPNGNLEYRPTILFAYMPCDASIASINDFRMNGYQDPIATILKGTSVVSGADEVGVLLLGHELGAWWTGSRLDHGGAMSMLPESNATSIQVAAGILGALSWMMQNPSEGFKLPEHLPHKSILAVAKKYIEPFCSLVSDWSPPFLHAPCSSPMTDSPWQLTAMLREPSVGNCILSPIYMGSSNPCPLILNTHADDEDKRKEKKDDLLWD